MRILGASILLSISCLTIATDVWPEDFRKSNWGDSSEAVRQVAGEPTQAKDDTLVYKVSISGLDAYLLYNFVANKLSSAGYLFTEKHSNDNVYLSDFRMMQELLIRKYGKPASNKSIWNKDLYRDNPSKHGFAVSLGHYAMQNTWETERTKILHTVRGDNFKITHGINYSSKELESFSEELKEKEAIDQL